MNDADNTSQPAMPAGASMEEPGRLLARSREAQNLSVADVARQLKLSASQIEALEAGQYQKLPGTVFVRGFIRNYARLLRLDSEALLRAAGNSLPQTAPRPETPPSHDIPFPTAGNWSWGKYAAAAAVAVVAVLAVYEFYWNEPETVVRQPVAVAPKLVPAVPQPARTEAAAATPPAESEARSGEPVAATPLVADPAKELPSAAAAAGALRDYDKLPRPGERQVRMKFERESWVEIRDRNEKVIFSQLNRPGTEQSVSGRPPLALVVGNAHGVKLIYDDQPVDLARHTKIDVARFVLP